MDQEEEEQDHLDVDERSSTRKLSLNVSLHFIFFTWPT